MEFLSNPAWQLIVNVAIGFLTISVTVLLFRKQIKRKGIAYEVVSDAPVLSIKQEIKGRVQVLFDTRPVSNARLVILKIWNTGNIDLLPDEFIDPIRFNFGENAEILDAEILGTTPSSIKSKVALKIDTGSLILEPLLLNTNESITLKVLVTQAQLSGHIDASVRIIGINQIQKFDTKIRTRHPLGRAFIYFSYIVLISSIIYILFSRYESSFNTKIFLLLIIIFSALFYILIYVIMISFAYKFGLKMPFRNAFKMVFGELMELIKFMIYETVEEN